MVQEQLPLIDTFQIGQAPGKTGDDAKKIIILEQQGEGLPNGGRLGPLFGMVENFSRDNAFTFNVEESSDNGDTDAYANVNIRVDGSDVANVQVEPLAKVVFTLEGTLEAYLRFMTNLESGAWGRLVLARFGGKLVLVHGTL